MSSPIAPDGANALPNSSTTQALDKDQNEELDAEMEDTEDLTMPTAAAAGLRNNANESSLSQVERDTQPISTSGTGGSANAGTSTNPHLNRKDATLREFMSKMDDYAPIIPDAVTAHYLTLSGLPPPSTVDPTGATTNTTPLPLARLLALATQKFIADIAADAYQYSRIRSSNTASTNNPLGNATLPGQGIAGAGGVGGGAAKGQQVTQLGVQRSGFGGGGQGGGGQGRTVLTMEDLGMAVQEYGVNVKRGEFYR